MLARRFAPSTRRRAGRRSLPPSRGRRLVPPIEPVEQWNLGATGRRLARKQAASAGGAGAPCWLSQLPGKRPVGLVAAKGSRVDRVLEVPRERGVLLPNPLDALADAAGDGLARPVIRVRGLARPATEPVGGRQLLAQELDLTANPFRPARVGPLGRLGELRLEVLEPLAVRGACRRVEPLTRVAEAGGDRARVASACGLGLAAGGEVGTVELRARVTQQAGDVLHALRVLQPQAFPLVSDRPDVAVAPEDRGCRGGRRAFRYGLRARLLAEAGGGSELHHLRFERLHPNLVCGRERLRGERRRALPVAGPVARDEHARVAVLGVRDPDARADPRIHLEGLLEVALGVVVAGEEGREEAERPRNRSPAVQGTADRAAISIGEEEIVERRCPSHVANEAHDLGEPRHRIEPPEVARVVREVGGKTLELSPRLLSLLQARAVPGRVRMPVNVLRVARRVARAG